MTPLILHAATAHRSGIADKTYMNSLIAGLALSRPDSVEVLYTTTCSISQTVSLIGVHALCRQDRVGKPATEVVSDSIISPVVV